MSNISTAHVVLSFVPHLFPLAQSHQIAFAQSHLISFFASCTLLWMDGVCLYLSCGNLSLTEVDIVRLLRILMPSTISIESVSLPIAIHVSGRRLNHFPHDHDCPCHERSPHSAHRSQGRDLELTEQCHDVVCDSLYSYSLRSPSLCTQTR